MRRRHFEAFAPVCAVCAGAGRAAGRLILAETWDATDHAVQSGILHCPDPTCRHEYPILDGIPVIVPDLARLLRDRGVELLLRDDLPPALESLFGDAIGPDSWFDTLRQTLSTYAWDAYADLDPDEADTGFPRPGAVRRCLAALLDLAGAVPAGLVLDAGCGAGRSSFDLAAACPGSLVLGIDTNLALLRLAVGATAGRIAYPRRRIGLVYDRRAFGISLPGTDRVDFWAADAMALPFPRGGAACVAALNLLDCVPDPVALLSALAAMLQPGGKLLLATPYDWSARATPIAGWIGGHSQRAPHAGAAEALLRSLLTEGAHPRAAPGLCLLNELPDFAWHTRLHDRSTVFYAAHLLAAEAKPGGA